MKRSPFDEQHRQYYLIRLQYLGFRFHGWQKQPNDIPTVERMVLRTLRYVFDHSNFKVLAAGRTDARVSVNETWIELFLDQKCALDLQEFLKDFNLNLPSDIKALDVIATTAQFNIIQAPKIKEYIYLFCCGEKMHPFAAPLMTHIKEPLDIELMKQAAAQFIGTHDFYSYTYKPKPDTQTVATILSCSIEVNTLYTASFFPEISYVMRVKGQGFKRHQIRLMAGALIDLGKGAMSLQEFTRSLDGANKIHLSHIAPASGLQLYRTELLSNS
ncbi:MAG: tRNA pseudouridine(38-40) synthase TruA [Nonlabens sp.]